VRVRRKFDALFATEMRSAPGIRQRVDSERFDFSDVGEGNPDGWKPAKAGALHYNLKLLYLGCERARAL
jgi:hypothetical protein